MACHFLEAPDASQLGGWTDSTTRRLVAALLLCLSARAATVLAQQAVTTTSVGVHEEILGELDPDTDPDDDRVVVSPDGRRVAWTEKRDQGWVVLVNGEQQGGAYEAVEVLSFHGEGKRIAFKARSQDGWLVVIDGVAGPSFENVFPPVFSADGRRYGYGIKVDNTWGALIDGEPSIRKTGPRRVEGLSFDEGGALRFSADTQEYAFRIRRGKREKVIRNGIGGKIYEEVGDPLFTPQGSLIYPAKRHGKWVIVIDDKESGPEWNDIWRGTLYSHGRLMLRGLSWAEFDEQIGPIYFVRSENGKSGWTPYAGKTLGPELDTVTWPIFFGEGRSHFVYAGTDVDDGLGGGSKGVGQVVVDGEAGPAYEGESTRSFGRSMLSVAMRASIGFDSYEGLTVGVLPRFEARWFGISTPVVSPDGKHVAYAARRAEGDYVVAVDSEVSTPFQSLSCGPAFTNNGTLVYVGVEGDELVLVKDGKPVSRFEWKDAECLRMITAEEDIVYVGVHDDGRRVFVNESAGPLYKVDSTQTMAFVHNDELHVAYAVLGEDESHAFVVIDGVEGSRYDHIFLSSLHLTDEESIAYVARRDRTFLRVTHPVRSGSSSGP